MVTNLNIRVYGLLEYNNQLLLVNEKVGDFSFTKFPGGGLELGEGVIDCLVREFKEETYLDIIPLSHFYTTDFFQQSYFKPGDQIISIYYLVKSHTDLGKLDISERVININGREEYLNFKWVSKAELNLDMLTFPIDKHVAKLYINT
jgi:ADP-ribose pyrophosphatase YjhB (NUDIX family)